MTRLSAFSCALSKTKSCKKLPPIWGFACLRVSPAYNLAMLASLTERLRSQVGAAVIETLGTMLVFLAALLLAMFIGISFYNLNILNSAAQNISLNTQVQVDRWCSPQQQNECALGKTAASSINSAIIADTNDQLLFTDPAGIQPTAIVAEPSAAGQTWPSGYQSPCASGPSGCKDPVTGANVDGWGYNTIDLSVQQNIFGGSSSLLNIDGLTLNAHAMTTSYKDPNR